MKSFFRIGMCFTCRCFSCSWFLALPTLPSCIFINASASENNIANDDSRCFGFCFEFEKLFMPGDVIQGHEELEEDCKNCHVRLRDTTQTKLCLDCHESTAKDISSKRGFHASSIRRGQIVKPVIPNTKDAMPILSGWTKIALIMT